ncbi:hypothetical protein NT6N_37670 [Oceaniferula spumae]|uniref:Uncharacterized protein n=1 Tax=Oceaniferula spumae TaxID=2979115 RepID=A0AAT9FRV2_9BACT
MFGFPIIGQAVEIGVGDGLHAFPGFAEADFVGLERGVASELITGEGEVASGRAAGRDPRCAVFASPNKGAIDRSKKEDKKGETRQR